jgi:hypothetical protein
MQPEMTLVRKPSETRLLAPRRLSACPHDEEGESFSVLGAWLGGVDHDAQVGTGHAEHVACPERQHRYTTVEQVGQ